MFRRGVISRKRQIITFVEIRGRREITYIGSFLGILWRQRVLGAIVNLHRNAFVKPSRNLEEVRQVTHTVMNLSVHEFVGNDINVLSLWANHDASAAADELCATEGIEPKRAKPAWMIEEQNDGFRFNWAEGSFNSQAGISNELSVALLIDLRFIFCKRTIGEFVQISYANKKARRWARKRKSKSGRRCQNNGEHGDQKFVLACCAFIKV